jgi:hydrogenase maturation protease
VSRVCILGIGSPSGDDQAGWLTVDALLDSGTGSGGEIVIEKLDRPGANLIPLLDNAAWVILVDAMQSEGPAGRIQRFDQKDWSGYSHGLSSHGFGVLDALSLAQALGCMPPRLDLYGIELGSAVPGADAGDCIQAAARQLAGLIAADLKRT